MRIEQLTKKQKHIRPNMHYLIDFNGTKQYFSKSSILELQSKLNELFICDVVSMYCVCDKYHDRYEEANNNCNSCDRPID